MKRDEILSEFKKGIKARKYNRRYVDPDRESETLIAPRIPPKKKDDIKEQRTDYTKDEILAVLTRQKTQAEVDAEALRTRGPDKGNQPKPTTPPPKTVQTKETTGAPVGKITKVDPTTKKATVTKTDGTTQEVDPTALKPTPDGKMQMDAPDTDDLTNKEVVSTEDALAPPGDSRSPIHGDEDHDEVSKLLVNRLRKLAGLQEQPAPSPAQTTTPTTNPAAAPISPDFRDDDDRQDLPPMPDISGLQPGQTKNLGDGFKVTMAADGNIHYTGGFGKVVYSPQGKPLSYDSPNFAGLVKKQDFSTGNTTTSYAAGPLNVSQTKNAQGQTIGSKGSYNVGNESVNADQAYKNGQPTIQTRTQTGITADDNLVKNQDTLNSARQVRPTAEDQQLEAMLRIAGLR
jgi:hypothetical protein